MVALKASLAVLRSFLFGSRRRSLFGVWLIFVILLLLVQIIAGSVNNRVTNISTFLCAFSTLLFWSFRTPLTSLVSRWGASPRTKFILIGSAGAIWVETLFWSVERVFGITGVAANPNLAIDLLATMPWYVLMIALLWRVQTTYRYTLLELLLLGGIYELGADGIFGAVLHGMVSLETFPLVVLIIPQFIMVYSFMILPSSYMLKPEMEKRVRKEPKGNVRRLIFGLLPLLGLIPYIVLFVLIFSH